MVCVKRKPLHLVFYLNIGESRIIIPGFCLCETREGAWGAGLRGIGHAAGKTEKCGTARSARVRFWVTDTPRERGYARGVEGTRRGDGALSVEGCGRGGKPGRAARDADRDRPDCRSIGGSLPTGAQADSLRPPGTAESGDHAANRRKIPSTSSETCWRTVASCLERATSAEVSWSKANNVRAIKSTG